MERILLAVDAPVALAASGDNGPRIGGVGVLMGQRQPRFPDQTIEFAPGSISESALRDVVLNAYDHDSTPFARTTAGNLCFRMDGAKLRYEADVDPEDHGFSDLHRRVGSGVIDGASIGFMIGKKGAEYHVDKKGVVHQLIHQVKRVFEVTLTHKPVFKRTTAQTLRKEHLYQGFANRFDDVPPEVLAERDRIIKAAGRVPPVHSKRRGAALAARALAGGR